MSGRSKSAPRAPVKRPPRAPPKRGQEARPKRASGESADAAPGASSAGTRAACRLFVLLARNASVAVVFRRGPSKHTLLLRWNTANDTFEAGQWFKGRVYEERCDLSPQGERLVYFAGKHAGPFGTWTAVSRPPYFTARALWPRGNAWGGGGLFQSEMTLGLNHPPDSIALAPGFTLPRGVRILPLGQHPGRGEDHPIAGMRMHRDGWRFLQRGTEQRHPLGAAMWIVFDPPEIWEKREPVVGKRARAWTLQRIQHGVHELDGPWKVLEYAVVSPAGEKVSFGRADWAEWDTNGDLLLAREGQLFRHPGKRHGAFHPDRLRPLIDLRPYTFTRVDPPAEVIW